MGPNILASAYTTKANLLPDLRVDTWIWVNMVERSPLGYAVWPPRLKW